MKRRVVIVLILLFATILNAKFFNNFAQADEDYSISQAEVSLYALGAIKNKYLNKSKLDASLLLAKALEAIQEELPEVVINYNVNKKLVTLQIYNDLYTIEVKRARDIYDILYLLRQVYILLEQNYKILPPLKMTDVEYAAINGILKKLDPHSYIFTPEEFKDFTQTTEGNFGGLGIVVSLNDDGEITVISPLKGTPAMEAGIEANDVIIQIDDESAINMTMDKAVERMRGVPGSKVTLGIKRKGISETLKFTLTRAIIKIESVVSAMPKPKIGYINLSGFMENTADALVSELKKLKKRGMGALILDMRNNSGGLLSQAIQISDLFLDKGTIVTTVENGEKEATLAEKERSDVLDIPIIVMINEGSASAAEIVTAALKKNNRATVIGRRSFGKGSVQNLIRIPGGGGLKLTVAQYLTPGNISIQSVGITPDIEIRPVYIHPDKISIFDSGENILKENDLEEHIISEYAPKKPELPNMTIRYFKEYKDIETLLKERRREVANEFKNDEEIEIATQIALEIVNNKKEIYAAAEIIKESKWDAILTKLKQMNIVWKKRKSLKEIDPESLKITMLSDPVLKGGQTQTLAFRAESPENVENLLGVFETSIPELKRIEIPFGTFSGSIERSVDVKLPASISWRKEEGELKLYDDLPKEKRELKIEKFLVETIPLPSPDLKFNLSAAKGKIDNKSKFINISLVVEIVNEGKGAILDGKALLSNSLNSKDVFIDRGTESFTLEPEKSITTKFNFRINLKSLESAFPKLTVSVYDYKTRYSASFVIPKSILEGIDAPKTEEKKAFTVKTPFLKLDKTPLISDQNGLLLDIEYDPSETKDVFVFLNNKKSFYKRVDSSQKNRIKVKLTFTKRVNEIAVVAKGDDNEKKSMAKKFVIYTKGEKERSF